MYAHQQEQKKRMRTEANGYGEIIRQQRLNLGLTQRQVADQCDITDSALAHIERGIRLPSEPVAGRIIDALQLKEAGVISPFMDSLKQARRRQAEGRNRGRATLKPIGGTDEPNAEDLARDLVDDPVLLEGCRYLKMALSRQDQRKFVLRTLKDWAANS